MDISVVIPLLNEEESLPELLSWIERVMKENHLTYEVVLVDDGSTDGSWDVIEKRAKERDNIKGIKFRRNYGKSAALHCGFESVKGDVVITMDADLQDSPDEIPELHRMIMKEGYDLVSGWKKKRKDPVLSKNLPSRFYNWTARRLSGIKLHDFNCGLKAYKRKVVKSIELYGDMHRYIPVIAKWAGFKKIGEKIVRHQERRYGVTKFGLERFIRGPLDLLSVMFISKFGKRPMHLFGMLGTLFFLAGFGIGIYFTIEKVVYGIGKMTDRPLFYLGLLAMILGTQLFLTGFLGEMISRNSTDRNHYLIDKKLNINDIN